MTRAGSRLAAASAYPQRDDAPDGALDRFAAGLAFRWRSVVARTLRGQASRAAQVRSCAARFQGQPLRECLPGLRYRLRRDDFPPEAVAECYGAVWAARARLGEGAPPAHVLGAADRLLHGAVVELADRGERALALSLAAAAFAAYGAPVHVLSASDARAASLAEALRPALGELGLGVATVAHGMGLAERREAYAQPVVCASWREVALNYLQDQLATKRSPRRLAGRIARLAGEGGAASLLRGLGCALVDDADAMMIDEAAAPAAIAAEADRSGDRLVYEQALELARTLSAGADFSMVDGRPRLEADAERRIGRFLAPLGGAWAAEGRRRQLVETALEALHARARDRDYRLEGGQVVFEATAPEGEDAATQDLHGMIELKEGCRLSARRDVLARLPAWRFFRRYVHLAGVCADARGVEGELWALYGLDTTLAGARRRAAALPARVFADAAAKHAALARAASQAAGHALVIAVSSTKETQALMQALGAAGVAHGVLRGSGDESEQRSLASLAQPGSVVLSLHPAEVRVPLRRGGAPLHLVVAEAHAAARHVERLREVYGAVSGEVLLSLDDGALAGSAAAPLLRRQAGWLAALAERRAESAARLAREEALAREQTLADLLAFSGAAD